jgi:hypothetical protein
LASDGRSIEARMAMMAMTTRSSIKVKDFFISSVGWFKNDKKPKNTFTYNYRKNNKKKQISRKNFMLFHGKIIKKLEKYHDGISTRKARHLDACLSNHIRMFSGN